MSKGIYIKLLITIIYLQLVQNIIGQNTVVDPVFASNPRSSTGFVNCIFQDRTGFIWIGKSTGLFRYDGYQLKSYRSNPSDTNTISNDNILCIYEDSKDYLWVGTKGGGLNRLDRKTGKFTRYLSSEKNPHSLSYNEVYSIFPTTNDNMWIGTDGGGFSYFNSNSQSFKTFRQDVNNNIGLRSNKILCFAKNGTNKLWLGTWSGGLHLFDTLSLQITHMGDGTLFSSSNIFDIEEVKPGILWLATWGQGLISYNINLDLFSTIIPPSEFPNFFCIQKSSNGLIWAGSGVGLLFFTSPDSRYSFPEDRINSSEDIICLYKDNTGTIWFGTDKGTVSRINLNKKKFSLFPSSLPFSRSQAVTVLSGKVEDQFYFSYRNNLIKFNKKTNQFKSFQSLYPDLVSMVNVPGTELTLCASSNGLTLFDHKNEKFSKLVVTSQSDSDIFNKQIRVISSNDPTGFWIGALGSAYKINREANTGVWRLLKVYHTGVEGSLSACHFPSCFLKDRKGNLWVGTWGGGLNCLPSGAEKFIHILHNQADSLSLSDNFVECMVEDHNGNIWLGTHSGVDRINDDKASFQHFSTSRGLANDWINSMMVDSKNCIWVSTQGGISCISENEKTIQNFDIDDGLPTNAFYTRSATKDSLGILYFGSDRGLIWFNPDSITKNNSLPKVVITDFRINNDTVPVSESSPLHHCIEVTHSISLNYKQSTFSFRISPLSFFNSKKNKIKYILKGYEKEWKLAGPDRIAKYSDIAPGKYIFSVIASNEDGIWNLNETNIGITIKRPFWRNGWSIAFYILSLIVFGNVLYRSLSGKGKNKAISWKKINNEFIQPIHVILEPSEMQFINKALNVVEENLADPNFGVDEMCIKMSISRSQLYRKINSVTGLSISEFIKEIRLKRAAQLLKQNPQSIAEIAYSVGFNDPKYFSKCFKQQFGVSPAQFIIDNGQSLPH